MGRIALPARTSKPCLPLQNPPRTRRDPPARPSSSTSLPTTRWTLPRKASASSSIRGRWSPPRRLWLLPPLARREQEASSCPPRSPRPRSPQPRRPRSPRLPSLRPPRSLPPRRLRSRQRRPRSQRLPRSPQPRRRRSRPRRPPPRRSRSSHSNLIVYHYSFFYLIHKSSWTTLSDLKFKSQRRPTFIINYL